MKEMIIALTGESCQTPSLHIGMGFFSHLALLFVFSRVLTLLCELLAVP